MLYSCQCYLKVSCFTLNAKAEAEAHYRTEDWIDDTEKHSSLELKIVLYFQRDTDRWFDVYLF